MSKSNIVGRLCGSERLMDEDDQWPDASAFGLANFAAGVKLSNALAALPAEHWSNPMFFQLVF